MMKENKRPIKRSIIIFALVFIALMCFVLSIIMYSTYTTSIYRSYNRRMLDIINYVDSHIDVEDLSECVESGEESEKFTALMAFMDSIMEDFDIHYLYIVRPVLEDDRMWMMNVISADTAIGRETDPDGYYLGFVLEDVYDRETLELYQQHLDMDEISYFKNFSSWGYDYTALKPLINAEGEHFAALCVDIEVDDVQRAIKTYTIFNVILIVVLGIMFVTLFILWMNRNITEPLVRLEKSVVSFAERSHEQTDPDLLSYDDPHIHTKNEVESLSNAVNLMSIDMRNYVRNIIAAEDRVQDMKNQVTHMDMLAYQDALTHVKNKAWYDKIEERVNADIEAGKARFAILMADLNNLKKINDNYGHEHGNDYIFGACHIICVIFDHSPVFRIGGDEFVVLMENRDYDDKDKLIEELKLAYEETSKDESKEPWERYSSAIGVAVFDSAVDKCMNDVFKRADEAMYKHKQESKMARE
ncbi:diguanylate cyclase (GGDEF) domain-containing protein [Butyrivibrio sp. INlla14]|nr:diguanylate cyclase (GGDEF) domain-containing protein [Butyrivibrio sp. INlla14]